MNTRDTMKNYARGGLTPGVRFDKAVGTDRKMGADYVKADRKQDRFMRGSSTEAKINRQDTRHGKVDMPFSKLNKYAGMKQGGNVKRYEEGGGVTSDGAMEQALSDSKTFKDAFREARQSGGKTFTWRGKTYSTELAKPKAPSAAPAAALKEESKKEAPTVGRRLFGSSDSSVRPNPQFRKGGIMKGYAKGGESKAMMKKEVEFMKKKGAPKSMVKHEMAEAKGKGYARGGGIERRGSGKGTVVKMAGGGYVRSADGVAKKGKTKGRMC